MKTILEIIQKPYFILFLILSLGFSLRAYKLKEIGLVAPDEFIVISTLKEAYESSIHYGALSPEFFKTLIHPPHGAYAAYGKLSRLLLYYPFFHFFKNDLSNYLWISVFWGLLTIFLTFIIGKKYFSQSVGLMAAFLVSLSPWNIQYARSFFGQIDSGFFVLLCAFFYLKRSLFLSSFMLGFSATMHGTTLYFLPCLILIESYFHYQNHFLKQLLSLSKKILILISAFFLPFLIYEGIGLLYAHASYLYSFFVISNVQMTEEKTAISPFYLFHQFWISNGIIFSILTAISIVYVFLKAKLTQEKKYFFMVFFPLGFFLLWLIQLKVLHSLFRYFFPMLPFLIICAAIAIEDFLKLNIQKIFKGIIFSIVMGAIVINNFSLTISLIKISQNSLSKIATFLTQKHIQNIVVSNSFYPAYFKYLYPHIHTIEISSANDLNILFKKSPQTYYFLISGYDINRLPSFEKSRELLFNQPYEEFFMPVFKYYPSAFENAYNSNSTNLLEQIRNDPIAQNLYLFTLDPLKAPELTQHIR